LKVVRRLGIQAGGFATALLLQERNGGHLEMPLLGGIFQNAFSDLELRENDRPFHQVGGSALRRH
jgi:hypothetical protein